MDVQLLTAPRRFRVEHLDAALGVGTREPRMSWEPIDRPDVTGYTIESTARDGRRWTTTLDSSDHLLVPWIGEPLASRERREIRVRGIAGDTIGAWSEALVVEAGLLDRDDWVARLIVCDRPDVAAPVLRRRFTLARQPDTARLYVTFHGIGRVTINGDLVSDEVLAPGWHSYAHRLLVRTVDVTRFLIVGENEIEIALGDGWFRGPVGFIRRYDSYGSELGAVAQLEVVVQGRREVIATDDEWEWRASSVQQSGIYDGETYDARLDGEVGGSGWHGVAVREFDPSQLEAALAPPVRRTQVMGARRVFRSPAGKVLVDFGQNLVGWIRLHVEGPAGTEITLRHAEVLEHGELGVRPLRTALATDRYVLAGGGLESWEPSFTFHGFRYVEVAGWPGGEPSVADLEAMVVHSDMELAGGFSTSHAGLDQLHRNVVWSMRGNFVSLPMDCPQRDERLGWTGDIAVFSPTAAFLYDCTSLLQSWLRDVAEEQDQDGLIPYFVPTVPFPDDLSDNPLFQNLPTAVWGDVCTLLPAALYESTGDPQLMIDALPMMVRWVSLVRRLAGDDLVWDEGFQYGDWLDPTAPVDAPQSGATEPALIATAFFHRSAKLTSEAASFAGEHGIARLHAQLSLDVRAAFRRRFLRADGRLTSHSQTAYAVALSLDLLDESERPVAGQHLTDLLRNNGHRIGTGFVGTPLVLGALTRAGAVEDAYRLALQTEAPSWLYAVGLGSTTIWERWDSMLPDGSINTGEMTSFNHYALGAIASWLHETVGGLSAAEPGYRRIRIAPRPHREVLDAATWHQTPYGRAAVAWRVDGDVLRLAATVPAGTTAILDLPGHEPRNLAPGEHVLTVPIEGFALPGDDLRDARTTTG